MQSGLVEVTWEELSCLKRDICYFFYEQAEYVGIDGDLDFGGTYALPYWRYLCVELPATDTPFVQQGCLLLILAMARDVIDGSGSYLLPWLDECVQCVTRCEPNDVETRTLLAAVRRALDEVRSPSGCRGELEEQVVWVNKTFIMGYFTRRAEHLATIHRKSQ